MTTKMTKGAKTQDPGYIERPLDLRSLLEKKSHFLLGPRQTGKTSLKS
jgi:predicted AAA+ superfamily ATPase